MIFIPRDYEILQQGSGNTQRVIVTKYSEVFTQAKGFRNSENATCCMSCKDHSLHDLSVFVLQLISA